MKSLAVHIFLFLLATLTGASAMENCEQGKSCCEVPVAEVVCQATSMDNCGCHLEADSQVAAEISIGTEISRWNFTARREQVVNALAPVKPTAKMAHPLPPTEERALPPSFAPPPTLPNPPPAL